MKFRKYSSAHRPECLAIFDANCPEYFSPNERVEYSAFLDEILCGYSVCELDGVIVGAFGLIGDDFVSRDLNWVLVSPNMQGKGVGSKMISTAIDEAQRIGLREINIAASHLSERFFAKFGAHATFRMADGWGPGMHRQDMVLHLG